ncbi:sugar kinase [Pseudaminobacter sp. 19-2017]|uniref:Sugar kinase n=1 Tax=Pseudaminobacter soli (ex Zhang et al. 2022) TaxID=2831468 RepID=A0A942I1S4_9HYPH|nr:sugar kinase [Pseudaminobacter soli]
MNDPARLLCVGALTYDTIFRLEALPCRGGKYLPSEMMQIAAGMAASAATAATRQGGSVSLWSSVGNDAVGREMIEQMRKERVDCSHVRGVEGGKSAISTILVDAEGERIVVPYYDPLTQSDPASFPFDLAGYGAVMVDARWPGAAALALEAARDVGIAAVFDADVAPKSVLERLLPLATHVVASLPAACILAGDTASAEEAAASLHKKTGVFVAVTDGARGSWFVRSGKLGYVPSPQVEAVDTLAAGDVCGTFALALAEDRDEEEALAFASAAAALKCRRFGGRLGAPTREETLAFMRGGDR